jgi:hypothetical protein
MKHRTERPPCGQEPPLRLLQRKPHLAYRGVAFDVVAGSEMRLRSIHLSRRTACNEFRAIYIGRRQQRVATIKRYLINLYFNGLSEDEFEWVTSLPEHQKATECA